MFSRLSRARIHVLVLSLLFLQQTVLVAQAPDSADAKRDSSVNQRPVLLAPLSVVGERYGYGATRTSTLTKTDTPLRDVPQTVSIITADIIGDQRMASLAEIVRFVPGVTMGPGEGHRDQPTIRGNNSTSDLFVDGIRDDAEYIRDLYNVERVEVPKGSNALIFGRGAGGGLINRVTKAAGWNPTGGLSLQGGRYNNKRGSLDLGRGLGRTVAARLNAVYENSDSYREYFNLRRYGLSPTVTLVAGSRTGFRAGLEHFNDHRTTDRGVPSFQGRPLRTDPSTFFGDPFASYGDVAVNAVMAVLDHRPSAGITLRNHTRYADYRKFYQNVYPGAVNAAGDRVTLTGYNSRLDRRNLFNQTDLTVSLRTGRVRHQLLAGAELGRQLSDALRSTAYFNNTATSITAPVAAPVVSVPTTFRQSASDADAHTTAVAGSAYLQDQIRLTPRVLAVAGLRYDRFQLKYRDNRSGNELERTDHMISPRVGVVVKPALPLSLYASYGVSFLPASGNQFTALTVTSQTLEPERFTNTELGAKWDPQPDLSLAAAVYQLDRTNTAAPDPDDPSRTIQTGSQRSKGFELSVTGHLTPEWQLLLGYGFQDVKITSRTTAAPAGAVVPLTPRHQASLWSRYQITPAVGLGLGLVHQAAMFAALDGAVTLPAFSRADVALFVRVAHWIHVQVNGENLFGATYYPTAHSNNNITPGSPRTVRAGLDLRY